MTFVVLDPVNLIQVLPNGALQIRESVGQQQNINGTIITTPTFHRYVLNPGDSMDGKDYRILAIANVVWTDDVIAAYKASLETAP